MVAAAMPLCNVLIAQNTCGAPSSSKLTEVDDYVAGLLKAKSTASVLRISESKANSDCYWRIEYQSGSLWFTIYLTPDQRFVLTNLYDLNIDPERAQQVVQNDILQSSGSVSQSLGRSNAPITIVEFADFACPYCRKLAEIFEKQMLPQNPNVRLVFRNYPLHTHPWAFAAAAMAQCVAIQSSERFWGLHDYIFLYQSDINTTNVQKVIEDYVSSQPDLSVDKLRLCETTGAGANAVTADIRLGGRLGVHITPTFFINGVREEGTEDVESLIAQIRAEVASYESGGRPKHSLP
jgi:protein-disulfide isomerase